MLLKYIIIVSFTAFSTLWLTNNHWEAKWAKRDSDDDKYLAELSEANLAKQVELIEEKDLLEEELNEKIKLLEAANYELASTTSSLHDATEDYALRVQSCSTNSTSKSEAEPSVLVLAKLLKSCTTRTAELAKAVDSSVAAGLACEQMYKNAIEALK